MSLAEIVQELPKLKRDERQDLARRLFDFADEEAAVLADCDRRADEHFLMLDAPEALWKLYGGEASPRAGTTGMPGPTDCAPEGALEYRATFPSAPSAAHPLL